MGRGGKEGGQGAASLLYGQTPEGLAPRAFRGLSEEELEEVLLSADLFDQPGPALEALKRFRRYGPAAMREGSQPFQILTSLVNAFGRQDPVNLTIIGIGTEPFLKQRTLWQVVITNPSATDDLQKISALYLKQLASLWRKEQRAPVQTGEILGRHIARRGFGEHSRRLTALMADQLEGAPSARSGLFEGWALELCEQDKARERFLLLGRMIEEAGGPRPADLLYADARQKMSSMLRASSKGVGMLASLIESDQELDEAEASARRVFRDLLRSSLIDVSDKTIEEVMDGAYDDQERKLLRRLQDERA